MNAFPVARSDTSDAKRPSAVPTMSALAVSMTLPPPTATMASACLRPFQKSSYRDVSEATSGFGSVRSITATSRSPRSAASRSTSPMPAASGKITTATSRSPTSEGSAERLPLPKRTSTGLWYRQPMDVIRSG